MAERDKIDFFIPGVPGTKGSVQAFAIPGTDRAVVVNDNRKTESWAAFVALAARYHMAGASPMSGPVEVCLSFYLPRPKAHYLPAGKRRPAAELRADAPIWYASRPDGDKMERATWDALKGIVFDDDALVAQWSGVKLYAPSEFGARVGTKIQVMKLGPLVAPTEGRP